MTNFSVARSLKMSLRRSLTKRKTKKRAFFMMFPSILFSKASLFKKIKDTRLFPLNTTLRLKKFWRRWLPGLLLTRLTENCKNKRWLNFTSFWTFLRYWFQQPWELSGGVKQTVKKQTCLSGWYVGLLLQTRRSFSSWPF